MRYPFTVTSDAGTLRVRACCQGCGRALTKATGRVACAPHVPAASNVSSLTLRCADCDAKAVAEYPMGEQVFPLPWLAARIAHGMGVSLGELAEAIQAIPPDPTFL